MTTRFAPSPTGRLHLGHALSAITGYEFARRHGGRFLLRIEDIDTSRCRPEYEAEIYDVLAWLGLTWETPVLRQTEHMAVYAAAARRLEMLGLLYPCFATRAEVQAAAQSGATDPDGAPLYPGLHRDLTPGEIARRKAEGQAFGIRLDMQKAIAVARAKAGDAAFGFDEIDGATGVRRIAIDPARWGDVIIQRKEVPTSYHLSVVIDDARQGVTLVTRGVDLRSATDVHRLLQILLDLPQSMYLHHPLLTGADGRKLAKSTAATSLAEMRIAGLTPAEVRRLIGFNPGTAT